MRTALIFSLAILLASCGGEEGDEGTAPTLSDLKILTSPVVRGQQANGQVTVADPDGLEGLKLKLEFSGPATLTLEGAIQGANNSVTEAFAPFLFILTQASPTGKYTLAVTAIDGNGNKSSPASVQFDVQ